MPPPRPTDALLGAELSQVCFVMDYLQLGFHGLVLNCYAPPRIHLGDEVSVFPNPGSRDALCAFISRQITAVDVLDEVRCVLSFGQDRIEIPLDAESRKNGDALEMLGEGGGLVFF